MIDERFDTIDVGEWYTEYRCKLCGEAFVVEAEDSSIEAKERHNCGASWPAV